VDAPIRTVLVHAKLARGPGFPLEAPHDQRRVECHLKRRDQALKLVGRHTRQFQELCEVGLHIGELDIGPSVVPPCLGCAI